MPQVTLHKIHKDASGRIRFRFGKSELEFASLNDAKEWVRGQLTPEALQAIGIALCLSRQPALGNPSALEGRTIDVDFSRANWGQVT